MDEAISIGTRGSRLALVQAEMVAAASCGWAMRAGSSSSRPTATAERRTRPGARARSWRRSSGRCWMDGPTSRSTAPRTFRPSRTGGSPSAPTCHGPTHATPWWSDGSAGPILDDLPTGTRVGTDSPRRTGFVRAHRPDLIVHPLHGNVDTRLRRLDDGETALVLACAGLDRLGRGDRIAERLPPGDRAAGTGPGCDRRADPARRRTDGRCSRRDRRSHNASHRGVGAGVPGRVRRGLSGTDRRWPRSSGTRSTCSSGGWNQTGRIHGRCDAARRC